MRTLAFVLLGMTLVLFPTSECTAPCSTPPPVGGDDLPPPVDPGATTSPAGAIEAPEDEGKAPAESPKAPVEEAPPPAGAVESPDGAESSPPPEESPPEAAPIPRPKAPAPGDGSSGHAGPTMGSGPAGSGNRPRPRPRGIFGLAGSWSVWWNMNREDLLGLRNAGEARTASTEGGTDPLPALRADTRDTLRTLARLEPSERVRAAALVALGRLGEERDAELFLALCRRPGTSARIRRSAAVGLAGLPTLIAPETRAGVRDLYTDLLENRLRIDGHSRLLAILALSLRASDDPALVRSLGARCARSAEATNEASALLFSCGLAKDPLLGPYLSQVVRDGKLGGGAIHDVARAHASLGLALCGEAATYPVLTEALTAPGVQIHTRRAAALALARILREEELAPGTRAALDRALGGAFDADPDVLVRGFAAVGLGGSRTPVRIEPIVKEFEKRRAAILRPFCALALALAARDRDTRDALRIRRLLSLEVKKAKDPDQAAAVCLAAGLAKAEEARADLLALASNRKGNPEIRGAACEALGLLGRADARAEVELRKCLLEESPDVVFGAALGLGLLGTRTTGQVLVARLADTKSEALQAHLVVALGHLGGTSACEPLLAIARDRTERATTRQAAVTALGLLLDPRERDPLFEIDATLNPYGLIVATRELVKIF